MVYAHAPANCLRRRARILGDDDWFVGTPLLSYTHLSFTCIYSTVQRCSISFSFSVFASFCAMFAAFEIYLALAKRRRLMGFSPLCRRRRRKSAKTNPICYFRLSEWQLAAWLFFAAPLQVERQRESFSCPSASAFAHFSLSFGALVPPHTLAHTHFCPNRQRLRRKAAKKRRNLKEKKKKRGRQKQTFRCSSFIASFWLVTVIWPLWKDMRSWQQQTAVRVSPLSLFLTSWETTTNGTAINCQKHSLKIAYFAGHSALLFGESTLIWFFIYPVQMVLHLKPKIKNWGNGLLHYLNKFFDDKYVWAIFSQLWYLRRDCTNFFLHFKLK